MRVRQAVEGDVDAVMRLLWSCIEAMRLEGIDQWDEVYPNRGTILTDIRTGALHLAFESGGEAPIAALVMNEIQDPQWSAAAWTITEVPVLVVHRVMVAPAHQGRGIARALMGSAEDWARARGYGAIRLDAFAQNPPALRLYESLGYRDAGGAMFRKGAFRCFEKRLRAASLNRTEEQHR